MIKTKTTTQSPEPPTGVPQDASVPLPYRELRPATREQQQASQRANKRSRAAKAIARRLDEVLGPVGED